MEPVLGDGLGSEVTAWMEACVARSTIRNAGEFNGFLKSSVPLFDEPLKFEDGAITMPAGYRPSFVPDRVEAHTTACEVFEGMTSFARPRHTRSGHCPHPLPH